MHREFLVMGVIMFQCQVQSEKFCAQSIEAFLQRLHNLTVQIDCCVARKWGEQIARTTSGIMGV